MIKEKRAKVVGLLLDALEAKARVWDKLSRAEKELGFGVGEGELDLVVAGTSQVEWKDAEWLLERLKADAAHKEGLEAMNNSSYPSGSDY